MQQDSFDFLKRLVDTPGPSGYEQRVQRVFRDRGQAAMQQISARTSLETCRPPSTLADRPASCWRDMADEIGFQIRYINDDGMLYFGSYRRTGCHRFRWPARHSP